MANIQAKGANGGAGSRSGNTEPAAGAAALTSSSTAVIACAACCVLPLMLPAAALAASGGVLAWLAGAHVWITLAATVLIVAAWVVASRTSRRTGLKPHRGTVIILAVSTALVALALAWPAIEPLLVTALQ